MQHTKHVLLLGNNEMRNLGLVSIPNKSTDSQRKKSEPKAKSPRISILITWDRIVELGSLYTKSTYSVLNLVIQKQNC